ncbi:Peptidoglycan/LPS O-acetylase OafA/YrhL, contains acyltransferase and SGNH-hydrolase domains [Devosia lucknowensis]|uniref:Peptidoglycan/LPS O-acetylase OafA/YrhL, contains acyltransferase and SGNH-hydrolase domains n=1 Tax=Devosia lucknowensis TaxID=1096929 RepID=A0A1Y6EEE2_9HYPH|nr:acyltransferase [Devosia lucknowensis]SMQ60954.1 Peptidoglycan/LPS O-acetylase OafA/YrhL, contains acyltransferase and SGNH-hydrolase domains [Devosia lucknowensis]
MSSRINAIQSLRAGAAIMVLASHALLYPYAIADQPLVFGRLGWLGVILFFVVSGFIMVAVTGQGRFGARGFLQRRILRVVPLYWAFTLAAAALALLVPSLFRTTVFDGQQLAMSLAFIPFYNPTSHGLHPLYKLGWTLNYEMFFYVVFAMLAVLTARRRVLVLTLAFSGLSLVGLVAHPESAIPAFYTSYMPLAFVAGAWLGLAHIEQRLQALPRSAALVLAAIGLAGLVEGFWFDRGVIEDAAAFLGFLAFATAAVTLFVGFDSKLPSLKPLEQLGDASYSIYLVHIFAVAAIAGVLMRVLEPQTVAAFVGIAAIAMGGGIIAGWAVYALVEKPLMARLRRLI